MEGQAVAFGLVAQPGQCARGLVGRMPVADREQHIDAASQPLGLDEAPPWRVQLASASGRPPVDEWDIRLGGRHSMSPPQPDTPRGHERRAVSVWPIAASSSTPTRETKGHQLVVDEAIVRMGSSSAAAGWHRHRQSDVPIATWYFTSLVRSRTGREARPGREPLGIPGDPAGVVQLQAVDKEDARR